ncbi:hypothetical protein BASA81_008041 [Batrachochytrium salamandrivorans]|nr:hypothetical protein BASA81_008041 [Batrachochytrium salamandrivorans]
MGPTTLIPTTSPSNAPTQSPATSLPSKSPTFPTQTPTQSPTVVMNVADAAAFQALANALGQAEWIDCNEPNTSPCNLCTNRELREISCEVVPQITTGGGRRLDSNDTAMGVTYEQRITGIKLPNVGIMGTIPLEAFAALGQLKHIDLANDPSLPYANVIKLPSGANCVNLEVCKSIPCNFGTAAPSCYTIGVPGSNYVEQTKPLSTEMIAAIAVPLAVVLLFCVFWVWLCYPSWKHPKGKAGMGHIHKPKQGQVLLHNRAHGVAKRQGKHGDLEEEEKDPEEDRPQLSRAKSLKRMQSTGNLKAVLAKAAGLGCQPYQQQGGGNHYAAAPGGFGSQNAPQQQYASLRHQQQQQQRPPQSPRLPPQYQQFPPQSPVHHYQQPPPSHAPPHSTNKAIRNTRTHTHNKPLQQQQLPMPGYNPWQEVYDPIKDTSYWINTMTRQISYTPM